MRISVNSDDSELSKHYKSYKIMIVRKNIEKLQQIKR